MKTVAVRAMLPKVVLEWFFGGPFHHDEEVRNRLSAYVGEAGWTRCERSSVVHVHRRISTNPTKWMQQRRKYDRSSQKHRQESDNERKPPDRRTSILSRWASRQSTPRDRQPGSDETKLGVGKKKRLICCRRGGMDSCETLPVCGRLPGREVVTELSCDAHSDLFGKEWGDGLIATINSVTERNDKIRG